jgi:hypothetical protein
LKLKSQQIFTRSEKTLEKIDEINLSTRKHTNNFCHKLNGTYMQSLPDIQNIVEAIIYTWNLNFKKDSAISVSTNLEKDSTQPSG